MSVDEEVFYITISTEQIKARELQVQKSVLFAKLKETSTPVDIQILARCLYDTLRRDFKPKYVEGVTKRLLDIWGKPDELANWVVEEIVQATTKEFQAECESSSYFSWFKWGSNETSESVLLCLWKTHAQAQADTLNARYAQHRYTYCKGNPSCIAETQTPKYGRTLTGCQSDSDIRVDMGGCVKQETVDTDQRTWGLINKTPSAGQMDVRENRVTKKNPNMLHSSNTRMMSETMLRQRNLQKKRKRILHALIDDPSKILTADFINLKKAYTVKFVEPACNDVKKIFH